MQMPDMPPRRAPGDPAGPAARTEQIIVRAFDVASSYDLRGVREYVTREIRGRVILSNPLVHESSSRRHFVVFEYGTIVFFNYEPLEAERVISKIKTWSARPNRTVGKDEFTLTVAPRGKRPEGTDELTVKELNRDTILLVAVVLSRSVALEYYEGLISESLARLEQTVAALASSGKVPRAERALARQVGLGLMIEHELSYNVEIFDDPDVVWDGGHRIEQLYRDLKREFDLDDRTKIIQQKVSLIARWSTFVISRIEAQRSRMLEWIIIILILSEILLVLFGLA
jgi:required for meiotic nuclear division protein 1